MLTHLTNVLKTNSVSFTVDGKFLFYILFLRYVLLSERESVCVCGRKHVKSIRKTIIIIFTITFFAIPKYTTLCNVFNSS